MTRNFDKNHLEIERRFLVEYPNIDLVCKMPGVSIVQISQTYFDTDREKKLRARTWTEDGITSYILTRKTKINDMIRKEEESQLTREEYDELIVSAVGNVRHIEKTRYCIPFDNKVVELDVFPFWSDKAIAEVELEAEDDELNLPGELKVLREITSEKSLTNYNLALTYGTKDNSPIMNGGQTI